MCAITNKLSLMKTISIDFFPFLFILLVVSNDTTKIKLGTFWICRIAPGDIRRITLLLFCGLLLFILIPICSHRVIISDARGMLV